jgi:hypothetical protein
MQLGLRRDLPALPPGVVKHVRAQNGKKLEAAYAQDLIDTAMGVQDALGCGTT